MNDAYIQELVEAHNRIVRNRESGLAFREMRKARFEHYPRFVDKFPQSCMTSGRSTGVRRRYQYGPHFIELWCAYERIRLEIPPKPALDLFISDFRSSKPLGIQSIPTIHLRSNGGIEHVKCSIPGRMSPDHFASWLFGMGARYRSMIVTTTPSSLRSMLLHGMTPFIQDDRLFVHLTGEKVPEDILELAKANGKIILDTMRVWNEGTTFITCEYGSKHMLDLFCDWSIDEKRRITRVTDLHNMLDRSIDTPCSDDIMMAVGECPCGRTNLIESINDRFSTTITTDRGILGYADLDGLFFSVMRKESVGRDGRSLTVVYARHEGRLYFMCNRSSNIPPSTRTAVTAGLQDIIGSLHGLDARTIFWESDATPKRLDGMPKFFPIMIVESDQELQLVIDSIC